MRVQNTTLTLGGRGWGRQGKGIGMPTMQKGAILRKCLNTFVPHCSWEYRKFEGLLSLVTRKNVCHNEVSIKQGSTVLEIACYQWRDGGHYTDTVTCSKRIYHIQWGLRGSIRKLFNFGTMWKTTFPPSPGWAVFHIDHCECWNFRTVILSFSYALLGSNFLLWTKENLSPHKA